MSPDEAAAHVESLHQVRRKGTTEQPAWYVRNRLVARLVDPTTLVIRVPMDQRDQLIADYPRGFGVPPRFEAHHKVEAYLQEVDPDGLRTALDLAWERQRR